MTDDLQNLLAGMVKPLEWDGKNGFWRAGDAIGGFYEICEIKGEFYLNRMVLGTGSALVPHPTLEAAQAAAQADYTARIASALNLDAVLALVAAAYADAAKVSADRVTACGAREIASLVKEHVVRATPTDATAALARMLADARADEREKAARKMDELAKETDWPASGHYEYAAETIRAMKGEQL